MADSAIQVNSYINSAQNSGAVSTPNLFGANVIATNPIKDTYSFSSTQNNTEKKPFDFGDVRKKFDAYVQLRKFKAYANEKEIRCMIAANPEVKGILRSVDIKPKIYMDNLESIYGSHFTDTVNIAKEIGKQLNLSPQEMKFVEKGALFHDFGKVLIPRNLLEKPSELTPEEKKIVSKHASLGYELLKTTGMEPEVLEIIKNHHKYKYNMEESATSKLTQIVTVADIYSALTTDRAYKKAMPSEQAIKILEKLSGEGKVDEQTVNALKTCLNKEKAAA